MILAHRSLAAWLTAGSLALTTGARAEAPVQASPIEPAASAFEGLSPPESAQLRSLQLRLDDVAVEEAGTSTVLPWSVVALGIGAIALGLGLGAERVASCEESCTGPFWPAWVLVAGAGVSTAGLVWLKLVEEDLAELRSRRFRLEMQIDAYEVLREARRPQALVRIGSTF